MILEEPLPQPQDPEISLEAPTLLLEEKTQPSNAVSFELFFEDVVRDKPSGSPRAEFSEEQLSPAPVDYEESISLIPENELPFSSQKEGVLPMLGSAEQKRSCQSCDADLPEGFNFCGSCGTRYTEPQLPHPISSIPSPLAKLILIHPDGSDGEALPLSRELSLGRELGPHLFTEDPFLSPRHATFYFQKRQLYIRDEHSLNGVFLRIRAEVEIFHGDIFRIGQQLLKFENLAQLRPVVSGQEDGTTVMGSPLRGAWGRLGSLIAVDTVASIWVLRKAEEFIGRERGDIIFSEDGFISGSHCRLSQHQGRFFLKDLGSTNGSYLKIKGDGLLKHGDQLLLGQQLFRVERNSDS